MSDVQINNSAVSAGEYLPGWYHALVEIGPALLSPWRKDDTRRRHAFVVVAGDIFVSCFWFLQKTTIADDCPKASKPMVSTHS